MLNNKDDIYAWLVSKIIDASNCQINDDLTVDVEGSMFLSNKQIIQLPFHFGEIDGDFEISNNQLMTLKGIPRVVQGYFYCANNKISNLDDAPEYANLFDFSFNPLNINLAQMPLCEFDDFNHACYKEEEKLNAFKDEYIFNKSQSSFTLEVSFEEFKKNIIFEEKRQLEALINSPLLKNITNKL